MCCVDGSGIHLGGVGCEKGTTKVDHMICKVVNDAGARICRVQIDTKTPKKEKLSKIVQQQSLHSSHSQRQCICRRSRMSAKILQLDNLVPVEWLYEKGQLVFTEITMQKECELT
jgi:hypothetical protein